MAFAILENGAWRELIPGEDVVIDDIASSFETITIWSTQMRASRGIKTIVDDVIPDGKVATGSTLVDDGGKPRRTWTLIDAPPPPVSTELHAAWIRAALADFGKADAVNAAVAAAGPVKQALWDFATTISRNDPDVIAIASACNIDLEALFRRADELRAARA